MKTNEDRDKDSVLVRDTDNGGRSSEASEGAAIDEYNDLFMYPELLQAGRARRTDQPVRGMDERRREQ